jgi:acyl-CoA thioesterase-1
MLTTPPLLATLNVSARASISDSVGVSLGSGRGWLIVASMAPYASGVGAAYGRRTALAKGIVAFGCIGAAARAAEPRRILALGDSLTAGFGLAPGQGFVPQFQVALGTRAKVLDAGVSGDTTAGGLARLDWALGERPHATIVELGANDGLRGLAPAQTEANLNAILRKLGAMPVLLSGMLAPPNLGAEYGRDFAGAFQRVAAAHPAAIFDPFFLEGVAGNPALNQADGIHPNAEGVRLLVRRLLPLVETLLSRLT